VRNTIRTNLRCCRCRNQSIPTTRSILIHPINRNMTKVKYRVINHILAASIYDESTNTRRDSQLDLDYCLSRDQRDKSTRIPAPGPKSLTDPHLSHTTTAKWKLSSSDSYSRNTITLRGRKLVLRTEQYCFLLPNRVSFTEINFKDYIRCTKTGRLEWMHP